jgi:hypothetical protein
MESPAIYKSYVQDKRLSPSLSATLAHDDAPQHPLHILSLHCTHKII